MKLQLVRAIDRYVGPPVCLLLTILARMIRAVRPAGVAFRDPVRRVLFVKLSEIGAVLCAYPLFRKVKQDFPEAQLVFVTFAKNREVFDLLGNGITPNRILTIRLDMPWHFIADTCRVLGFFLTHRIDIAFDLELFSRFSVILTFFSGAARRVGFYRYTTEGVYRGDLLTHCVQYNPLLHISRSFYSLYFALKKENGKTPELRWMIPPDELVLPSIKPSQQELTAMGQILQTAGVAPGQKILLLHIGDGLLPLREWPFDHYLNLAQKIISRTDIFLVFVGTQSDEEQIRKIMALAPDRCLNLNKRTNLKELMALFHIASLVFSTDCGLLHLAALSRIKKLVIFGPESPAVFKPLGDKVQVLVRGLPCSPCFSAFNHRSSDCQNNVCLKQISSEEVFECITAAI